MTHNQDTSASEREVIEKNRAFNAIATLSDKKYWSFYFLVVIAICVAGIGYFGEVAHYAVPPLCDFVDSSGTVVASEDSINRGSRLFHLRGFMAYGSFLGDGSERGADYTAEALHELALSMNAYYVRGIKNATQFDLEGVKGRVRFELRLNRYNAKTNVVVLSDAQVASFKDVYEYYYGRFGDDKVGTKQVEYFKKKGDIRDIASFFLWGAWLSAAARPGEEYSYTHNWPPEPLAGNVPTAATLLWSAAAVGVLFAGLMSALYIYGQSKQEDKNDDGTKTQPLTTQDLENGVIRPTQLACYKFFILSAIAFAIQVLAGVACAIDFVTPEGMSACDYIPYSVLRSYHTVFQIYWMFTAWVGTTIWFLPRFYHGAAPRGQSFLIELLFVGCFIVAAGGVVGIPLGQTGYLEGSMAYYFGSQGWEFMELGRLWQDILLAGFVLWILILYRGVSRYLTWNTIWSTPAWVFYGSLVMVWFLFFSLKVTPAVNFIVADFWRWMVVHMWVEVTFEVFTTVIIGYLYREMGIVSKRMAERATYIAVMLFFLTATIGVGHNFYWIAKPTGVIALGSAFSTTQVVPLILLTLDAWKFIQTAEKAEMEVKKSKQKRIMKGVWLFMVGVSFWNVVGAGILGSFVNLPVVNYYMHATYLTGNHAHAAMWGVKGNIAVAGMLFCMQHMVKEEHWSDKLLTISFWSLNGGIALQMVLSLFPIGLYHMYTSVLTGLHAARGEEMHETWIFQTFSKGRAIGGHIFLWGGLFPLVYFIVSRYAHLKPETKGVQKDKRFTSFWLDAAHTAPYSYIPNKVHAN